MLHVQENLIYWPIFYVAFNFYVLMVVDKQEAMDCINDNIIGRLAFMLCRWRPHVEIGMLPIVMHPDYVILCQHK